MKYDGDNEKKNLTIPAGRQGVVSSEADKKGRSASGSAFRGRTTASSDPVQLFIAERLALMDCMTA